MANKRKQHIVPFLLVLAASCIVVSLPVRAQTETLTVPDDYPTVSLAVKHALDGDIIYVKKEHTQSKP